jgi:putative polyketide hydroxylase
VRASITNATGESEQLRARFLIAADGTQSKIRSQLGISRQGEQDVYDSINIHFRADLTRWVDERPAALYLIEQADLRGTFLTINGTNRWGFLVTSLSHYGYTPAQFNPAFCIEIVRRAAGIPELEVEVLGVSAWTASALVAERYRSGPIFLAGDSAHEMPPTGGFGLNTGVQDVQNLAWKLAAVLRGEAGEALLESYDSERRPVGQAATDASLSNALSMGRTSRQTQAVLPRAAFLNEIGLVFGAQYQSVAVISEGVPEPVTDPEQQYIPSAAPGCRAPHVWLRKAGQRLSTLDFLGRDFVLFCGPQGSAWRDAAASLQSPRIISIVIGEEIQSEEVSWMEIYGLDEDGAVLVRPDGHVAWRSRPCVADPPRTLREVLDAILCRTG